MLFEDAMCLLARLLSSKNEVVWSRVAAAMCRVAPDVLARHKVNSTAKIRFVDFFLQVFSQGPKTWRKFSSSALSSVLLSFLELFITEFTALSQSTIDRSKFLSILAQLDPCVEWISLWLHSLQTRSIIATKLVELLEDFVDSFNNHSSELQTPTSNVLIEVCFQACVLLRSIRYKDILEQLDSQSVYTYVTAILSLFANSNQSFLNKSIQRLLLQFSCTHAGANYLMKYSLQSLLPPEVPPILRLKLACNIMYFCSQPLEVSSTAFQSLIQLANHSLKNQSKVQSPPKVLINNEKPKNSRQNMVYQLFHCYYKHILHFCFIQMVSILPS
uniref:Uncharacterized protein n=1 Tax=Ditylenchus dipsaci TaxID=166011 RepID=A0A915E856_9BILA